jgi:hypothetical protein
VLPSKRPVSELISTGDSAGFSAGALVCDQAAPPLTASHISKIRFIAR